MCQMAMKKATKQDYHVNNSNPLINEGMDSHKLGVCLVSSADV
jgi:hypothetical protein